MESSTKKGITANTLKWIAIITMFIDHIGAAIFERGLVRDGASQLYKLDVMLRLIGRVAFPIFCFLLVEGFLHTHNVKKYAINLALFSIISEYPFDLAFKGGFTFEYQNVFLTLFFGLLTIIGVHWIEQKEWKYKKPYILLVGVIGACVAELCNTDYGAIGVILIFILYITHKNRNKQCLFGAICFIWEITSVFSFLLIYFYNGVRKKGINKYFFYLFYPLHLLVLYGIHLLIK